MTNEEINIVKKKKYAVIVHAPAVNEWTYEVLATSQKEAEKIIHEGLNGDRELPDAVNYEQGKEVDGELIVAEVFCAMSVAYSSNSAQIMQEGAK
jgi:hypothetical protein